MQRQTDPDFLRKALDSTPKTSAGAIDLTEAIRIAQGGTHVLYRFTDSPFVFKVMKQNPNPEALDELEKKYAILYACFDKDGKQRCIREQHTTQPVLLPEHGQQDTALSIVPYESCFKAKVKFDFKIDPTELDPYLIEQHQALFYSANQALITKDSHGTTFNLNEYASLDPSIGAILKRLDSDPKLRDVMIEFLTHYRDFYQKTNIILDAVGYENILFYKDQSGDWQFKIGSAIKHDIGKYTSELYAKIHQGIEVDLSEFVNLTHAYFSPGNIRAVNACALKLGLEPVINDVPIDPQDLFKVSQRLSVPEQMLAYAQHGDFKRMDEILQLNKDQLNFNIKTSWAYARIAEQFTRYGRPLSALKSYLDIVSALPVVLPEHQGAAKQVLRAKESMIECKKIFDKKIMIHGELAAFMAGGAKLKSPTSTTAKLMDKGIATKSTSGIVMPDASLPAKTEASLDAGAAEQSKAESRENSSKPRTPFSTIKSGPKPSE